MTRVEVESRISTALGAAISSDEARRFIEEALEGENIRNLQVHWEESGYRCADLRWFEAPGVKHDLIIDLEKGDEVRA